MFLRGAPARAVPRSRHASRLPRLRGIRAARGPNDNENEAAAGSFIFMLDAEVFQVSENNRNRPTRAKCHAVK
jgi:hypothetical protein